MQGVLYDLIHVLALFHSFCEHEIFVKLNSSARETARKITKKYFDVSAFKGSLSRSKNENKLYKDLYCTLEREVLIRFIQRNQGHKDSMMHEFSSSVNKVNKAVAKVKTIGDRLPLGSGHFQSWVPGRRIFGRGMKLFSAILWGYKKTKSSFHGVQNC